MAHAPVLPAGISAHRLALACLRTARGTELACRHRRDRPRRRPQRRRRAARYILPFSRGSLQAADRTPAAAWRLFSQAHLSRRLRRCPQLRPAPQLLLNSDGHLAIDPCAIRSILPLLDGRNPDLSQHPRSNRSQTTTPGVLNTRSCCISSSTMVILDEKTMYPPPPPYVHSDPVSPPPFPSQSRPPPTLVTLPPHLLLRIVYETFPPGKVQNQRKVLYWFTMSLRLVNRALYVACMHVLRSTYLPAYASLIRPPYTSDPFPLSLPDSPFASYASSSSPLSSSLLPLQSMQRETRILDLYIALKVREDVWTDDSELHLEREESFKDLFDLMQPRARLEDLIRAAGRREGIISVMSSSGTTPLVSSPSPKKGCSAASSRAESSGWSRATTRPATRPLPFHALSVSYSPRSVGVVLMTKERKRTIVQVPRSREETLEDSAKKLVRELRAWVAANPDHGIR